MEKVRPGVFLTFNIGDVEDPDMYANIEVDAWAAKNRDAYKFLLEYSDGNMRIHRQQRDPLMGHKYTFTAEMLEKHWAEYYLKYGDNRSVSRH